MEFLEPTKGFQPQPAAWRNMLIRDRANLNQGLIAHAENAKSQSTLYEKELNEKAR